jgi:hypothetical protein
MALVQPLISLFNEGIVIGSIPFLILFDRHFFQNMFQLC